MDELIGNWLPLIPMIDKYNEVVYLQDVTPQIILGGVIL
jgi:hypothetical protein